MLPTLRRTSPRLTDSLRLRAASQQVPVPEAGVARLPDVLAGQTGDRLDAGFAALAPLHHHLQGLQAVKAVDFQRPVAGDQAFFDGRVEAQFQLRPPPRHRQARPGHQREFQLLRPADHLFAPGEGVRQVLVVVDRHAAPGLAEDGGDLLHHFQARVEDLALVVARVVAVFADEQDAFDRQLAVHQQGVADGARDADAEVLGQVARQVVVGRLIDVERGDVEFRHVGLAGQDVAVEETAGDVIRMGERPVDGRDDGERLAALDGGRGETVGGGRHGARPLGGGDAAGEGEGGGGGQEFAARAAEVTVEHESVPGGSASLFELTTPCGPLPGVLIISAVKVLTPTRSASEGSGRGTFPLACASG